MKLKGIPVSTGKTEGEVKKVSISVLKTKKFTFKAGDILVTQAALPIFSPLFLKAKAVVTETGGRMSHAAIIAREFSIPAVVGVKGATRYLKNGDWALVDGDNGIVYSFKNNKTKKTCN